MKQIKKLNQQVHPIKEDLQEESSDRKQMSNIELLSCSSPNKDYFQNQQSSPPFKLGKQQFNYPLYPRLENVIVRNKIKLQLNHYLSYLTCRMIKVLQQKHYILINDATQIFQSDYQRQIKNTAYLNSSQLIEIENQKNKGNQIIKSMLLMCNIILKKTVQFIAYIDQQIPIINPSSQCKLYWDSILILINLIFIFFIPIHLIYGFHFMELILIQFTSIVPIFLIIDLVLNFTTGYFEKGQLIKDRTKIFTNWARNMMIIDLISTLPIIYQLLLETYLLQNQGINGELLTKNYFLILFFLKLKNIIRTINKFSEAYTLQIRTVFLINLAKLFGFVILMGHLLASVWLFLGYQEKQAQEVNWITAKQIDESSWQIQYLYSYYYSCVTMITIGIQILISKIIYYFILGYGDITPTSPKETLVCIFLMFFACGVFGYNLNTINYIFQNVFQLEEKIKQKFIIINNYMQKKRVSSDLQYQIREYLDYVWRENSQDVEVEGSIIGQLSDILREKLLIEANKIVLIDSPIFCKNFSEGVISKTVSLIKEYKCTPGELIYLDGDKDDCSIYFLEKGSVEYFASRSNLPSNTVNCRFRTQLHILRQGDYFGAESFFTGQERNHSVRSCEFTTLLQIKRQDFLNLISMYQEDLERFSFIKDNIMLYSNFDQLQLNCISCKSNMHSVYQCPYIHFVAKKPLIILKNNYSQEQLRAQHQRKLFLFRTLKSSTLLMSDMDKFQLDNYDVLDNYELQFNLDIEEEDDELNATYMEFDKDDANNSSFCYQDFLSQQNQQGNNLLNGNYYDLQENKRRDSGLFHIDEKSKKSESSISSSQSNDSNNNDQEEKKSNEQDTSKSSDSSSNNSDHISRKGMQTKNVQQKYQQKFNKFINDPLDVDNFTKDNPTDFYISQQNKADINKPDQSFNIEQKSKHNNQMQYQSIVSQDSFSNNAAGAVKIFSKFKNSSLENQNTIIERTENDSNSDELNCYSSQNNNAKADQDQIEICIFDFDKQEQIPKIVIKPPESEEQDNYHTQYKKQQHKKKKNKAIKESQTPMNRKQAERKDTFRSFSSETYNRDQASSFYDNGHQDASQLLKNNTPKSCSTQRKKEIKKMYENQATLSPQININQEQGTFSSEVAKINFIQNLQLPQSQGRITPVNRIQNQSFHNSNNNSRDQDQNNQQQQQHISIPLQSYQQQSLNTPKNSTYQRSNFRRTSLRANSIKFNCKSPMMSSISPSNAATSHNNQNKYQQMDAVPTPRNNVFTRNISRRSSLLNPNNIVFMNKLEEKNNNEEKNQYSQAQLQIKQEIIQQLQQQNNVSSPKNTLVVPKRRDSIKSTSSLSSKIYHSNLGLSKQQMHDIIPEKIINKQNIDPYFGFDLLKSYQFYFPNNNIEKVLLKLKMKRKCGRKISIPKAQNRKSRSSKFLHLMNTKKNLEIVNIRRQSSETSKFQFQQEDSPKKIIQQNENVDPGSNTQRQLKMCSSLDKLKLSDSEDLQQNRLWLNSNLQDGLLDQQISQSIIILPVDYQQKQQKASNHSSGGVCEQEEKE